MKRFAVILLIALPLAAADFRDLFNGKDLTGWVNVNTGKVAWRVNLGVSDIMPEGKRDTGRPNLGAPLTTASGLIFIGATDDSRFRAFDSKTGKELWVAKMDAGAHAAPITYQGKDGKQYVVIPVGGTYRPAELLALCLP